MRFTVPRNLRPVLLALAGCATLLYLANVGTTQPGDKPAVGKTSYDQVSPALTGQISFAEMMAKDKEAKAGVMDRHKALLAERYNLAPERLADIDFTPQVQLMQRATETLSRMVRLLRKMPPLEAVKALNDQLQSIESEADEVMLALLRDLYCGEFEPIKALMLRDLYDLLERAIDRCRDCGNAISHIVLKNT